jgi:glycosyltransferase involved in cell wall biosynthesis
MANGRALVSTSIGWEGLPHVQPDRQLLVADRPGDFAAATLRLLRDPELRSRLAAEGRATAERHYDWRGLGDQQEALLVEVAGRTTTP